MGQSSTATPRPSVFAAILRPSSWMMAIIAVMLLTMPGCGGCGSKKTPLTAAQKKKEAEEKKKKEEDDKKKKKLKPDFEVTKLKVAPADPQVMINYGKPGHWVSTQQLMRANNFNFSAEIVTTPTDGVQKPVLIEGTPYHMKLTRPAALAKGQARYVETICPIPTIARESRRTMVSTELLQRRAGTRAFGPDFEPTARMMDYQFMFVILSSNPDNFSYVKVIDSIDPPLSDEVNNREVQYYHVMSPRIDKRVPVPSHSLTWTSIAYVIWDRVNPDLMTEQQKNAMIDWLHWGGQLIINGPDNLDALKTSFLGKYLPADHGGAAEFSNVDFEELNRHWSLTSATKKKKVLPLELLDDEKLLGVKLAIRPEAIAIPNTGNMVVERQVGRGRVVTTAFSLSARHFKRWGSMDNFFNNCLLRRPARTFDKDEAFMPTMRVHGGLSSLDPRTTSNLRYFSRDLPSSNSSESSVIGQMANPKGAFQGYVGWKGAGVGGWNDHSGVSSAARTALKQAAGITVPDASFVLRSVGVYLLILVPLNWLFFRLIGRVEWAWVAAPVIAVVGSLFVVKVAELDIGFARSLTETSVLELHGGYDRGHLTRYIALYTSLSTDYDLNLEDSSSLAMPFSPNLNFQMRLHDRPKEVTLRRDSKVTLTGFQVASNSTGMLHAEQMVDVGPIELLDSNGPQLSNQSKIKLLDAMVLRRLENGELETSYLGEVEPETTRPLQFKPAEEGRFPEWEDSRTCAFSSRQIVSGSLSLSEMSKLATTTLNLLPNEQRLVAWTDQAIPGASTKPAPAQTLHRTMILVHLDRPEFKPPLSDANLRIDFTEDDERVLNSLDQDLYKDDFNNPNAPNTPLPAPFSPNTTPPGTPAPSAPAPGAAPGLPAESPIN